MCVWFFARDSDDPGATWNSKPSNKITITNEWKIKWDTQLSRRSVQSLFSSLLKLHKIWFAVCLKAWVILYSSLRERISIPLSFKLKPWSIIKGLALLVSCRNKVAIESTDVNSAVNWCQPYFLSFLLTLQKTRQSVAFSFLFFSFTPTLFEWDQLSSDLYVCVC